MLEDFVDLEEWFFAFKFFHPLHSHPVWHTLSKGKSMVC
jgi:hypothetical protein